jgi:divalent metal cation (Fe/Co/Zn/Cd) transporter
VARLDESRQALLKRALLLQTVLLCYNALEGLIAVTAGLLARSVALTGFGVDSFIETTSTLLVTWRLRAELKGGQTRRIEALERRTARITGGLLLALAAYLVLDGGRRLLGRGPAPEASIVGLVLMCLSLVAMPWLGWSRLRLSERLGSAALRADAVETLTCAWFSFTTLVGLGLNAAWGWSWADPLAGLLLVPWIVREGLASWRGECACAMPALGPAGGAPDVHVRRLRDNA